MGVETSTRSEAAYQKLRSDIISCRLAPGERVTEKQLSADLGFGISPVRDALSRLETDGLVRTFPRKGYQVTPISVRSIEHLFDIWELLGPEMMSWGVRSASVEQLELLSDKFRAIEALAMAEPDSDTLPRLIAQLDEIFELFAVAAGNPYLTAFFLRLRGDMARVWSLVLGPNPAGIDVSSLVLENFLAERDAAQIARSTRAYIRKMRKRIVSIVAQWPSVVDSEVLPLRDARGGLTGSLVQ